MKPLIMVAAGGDADIAVIIGIFAFCTAAVVLPIVVALVLWVGTTLWALASLTAYPRLVPSDSRGHNWWCAAACVPLIGPGAYLLALLSCRVTLGRTGWHEARSRPRGFVPQPPAG